MTLRWEFDEDIGGWYDLWDNGTIVCACHRNKNPESWLLVGGVMDVNNLEIPNDMPLQELKTILMLIYKMKG